MFFDPRFPTRRHPALDSMRIGQSVCDQILNVRSRVDAAPIVDLNEDIGIVQPGDLDRVDQSRFVPLHVTNDQRFACDQPVKCVKCAWSCHANAIRYAVQPGEPSNLQAGKGITIEGTHFRMPIQQGQPDSIIALGTPDIDDSFITSRRESGDEIVQLHLIRTDPLRRDRSPNNFVQIPHTAKRPSQNFRPQVPRIEGLFKYALIKIENL